MRCRRRAAPTAGAWSRSSARLRLRVDVLDDGLAIALSLGTLILRDVQLVAPTDSSPPIGDAVGSA